MRGEERPGSFLGWEMEDAEGGLSGWEAREEWFEAGLAESRRDGECRMWEGREKDCSKGLGSRSKSERVCRRDCRRGWWWSAEGDSAFFVGVGMTGGEACGYDDSRSRVTHSADDTACCRTHVQFSSDPLGIAHTCVSVSCRIWWAPALVFAGPCAIACFPSRGWREG